MNLKHAAQRLAAHQPTGSRNAAFASETSCMNQYLVFGLTRSYFTRQGDRLPRLRRSPWRLEPGIGQHPAAAEAGWNGGIPVVTDPNGVMLWDSTSIIEHMNVSMPLEKDPCLPTTRRCDSWRSCSTTSPTSGSTVPLSAAAGATRPTPFRRAGSWPRNCPPPLPVPATFLRERIVETMTGSLPKLGVTEANIDAWMTEVLDSLDAGARRPPRRGGYLLGGRPSIADFAVFGANAAHFVGDAYCRELVDEHGPAAAAHTYRFSCRTSKRSVRGSSPTTSRTRSLPSSPKPAGTTCHG